MKILPIVNDIKTDITTSGVRIKSAATDGYSVAERTAKIYKHNSLHKYINITRSIGNKIIKGTTVNELPYIGGALGMLVPLPLFSPLLMGVGIVVKYISGGVSKFSQKMHLANNKAHS